MKAVYGIVAIVLSADEIDKYEISSIVNDVELYYNPKYGGYVFNMSLAKTILESDEYVNLEKQVCQ